MITLIDVIIEAMPFSNELIDWCKKNPEFKEALKFSNPEVFIPLGVILTTHTKNAPQDEIIGFYTYDYDKGIFKQDFIVNVGGNNKKFILYTKLPNKKYSKYVQHINQFFTKYGKNGDYANTHHVGIEAIEGLGNQDLSDRAHRAIQNGALIKKHGRRPNTQSELKDVLAKIKVAKSKL